MFLIRRNIFFRLPYFLLLLAWCGGCVSPRNRSAQQVSWYLTTPDQSALFARQPNELSLNPPVPGLPTIIVDPAQTFQAMDGFGYTLTGGSAMLLHQMSPAARAALLQELFAVADNSIGVSYLRVSIGASDLDARVFSYNDLPEGQTDPGLEQFSLAPDQEHLIPVLREILAINPTLKIMASPWSPPAWMKTNSSSKGGQLKPEWYDAYARYFVKYIQGMAAAGIRIDAVTVQNEPLHPGNNPSLLMEAPEQAAFIRQSLGPAFRAAGLQTKIIIYDHNADRPDYPISILNDPEARQYVDGTAFHLYGGDITALSQVHAAHPDKHLYFTEQWIGAPGNFAGDFKWHVRHLLIGAPRNWARTVLEWNLAADPQQKPHTPGGCTQCLGALTLDGDRVTRNTAYYIIAHASRFVRPGSVRLASGEPENLPNVAFRNPAGQTVLIVLNTGSQPRQFQVQAGAQAFLAILPPGAAATYVWRVAPAR